jgi:hypothetical protein
MPTINDIEARARKLSDALTRVNDIATELDNAIAILKKTEVPKLRKAVASAAEHEAELKAMIEAEPGLFVKPKTVTLHGIKCGFQKGKGRLEYNDGDKVVALIRKHFPDQAAVLIITDESPSKDAMASMTVADLKKIGVSVKGGNDQVIVKPVDGAGVKMAQAMLAGVVAEVA